MTTANVSAAEAPAESAVTRHHDRRARGSDDSVLDAAMGSSNDALLAAAG